MKPSSPVCPTCKGQRKPQADNPTFPFCSARCKLADLGNWLSGRYALDAEPAPSGDEDERRRLN
ncbi:MAG TPA: DNA gyrase inhibitor YacG [Polyangiales bacterium]